MGAGTEKMENGLFFFFAECTEISVGLIDFKQKWISAQDPMD